MMKKRAFYYPLLFIFALAPIISAQAKTVYETIYDLQKEKVQAIAEADAAKQGKQEAFQRVADARAKLEQKISEKRKVLKRTQGQLNRLAEKKVEALRQELDRLQEKITDVEHLNFVHARDQKSDDPAFSSLMKKFEIYKESESKRKADLNRWLDLARTSSTTEELSLPQVELRKLYRNEQAIQSQIQSEAGRIIGTMRMNYEVYQEKLKPHEGFLIENQLSSVEYPKKVATQLEQIIAYARERGQFFSQVIPKKLSEMARRSDQMVDAQVDAAMEKVYRERLNSEIYCSFLKKAGDLAADMRNLVLDSKTKAPDPGIYKLQNSYDLFQKLLGYRNLCKNPSSDSPYHAGCLRIKKMIRIAEDFLENGQTDSWDAIGYTLYKVKDLQLDHLNPWIKPLERLEKQWQEGKLSSEALLTAIRLHDEMIDAWHAYSAKDSKGKEGEQK